MASALKYFTLPKSKVTIWEKPLKAGGVFYYLYLDQSQIDSYQAKRLGVLIGSTVLNFSVKVKKTTKTYQISYSLPNGEKAQDRDESMLEMLDDKLASFGYDDTKNQAVGTRGKKMIGTYATTGQSTITVTKPASPDYRVGDLFYSKQDPSRKYKIFTIGANVTYAREKETVAKYSRKRENFEEKIKSGIWVIEKAQISQPEVEKGQYYIDYDYKGILKKVSDVGEDYVYFDDSSARDKKIFKIKQDKGEYERYIPSGGDEWVLYDKTSGAVDTTYRVLSADTTYVTFAKYERGNYISTDKLLVDSFCGTLITYDFQISQGGQASQSQTPTNINWQDGDLVVTFDGLPRQIKSRGLKFVILYYHEDGKKKELSVGMDIFINDLKEGLFKIYEAQVGDIWESETYISEITDVKKDYLTIKTKNKDTTFTFTADSEKNQFYELTIAKNYKLIKEGGQSTSKPEIKKGQYYIDTTNNNKLLRVDDVTKNWLKITESEDDFNTDIPFDAFSERISEGKYKLYTPSVGDLWKRYDGDGGLIGTNKIVSVSDNVVFEVKFELREYTLDFSIPQFLENLRKSGYQNVTSNSNSEPKTEYEKEEKQFAKSKHPQYSEKSILKKELKDLVELKDLISDLDFEDKVNVSTLIIKTQNKINDIIAKEVEQRIGETKIFDELFEQSFNTLKRRYDDTIEKNDLVELVAPNGQVSDLNEGLTNLVNSELFKEWFGDFKTAYFYRNLPDFGGIRVSKVLSEKFEPLVVWHGTNKQFSYFRFDNFPAAYFAVNRKYSDFFATARGGDGYVLPFFISINNPLDLSSFGIDSVKPKDFFDWMYLKTGLTPEELEVNPIMIDPSMKAIPIWMYLRNNISMLKKIAEMGVYDGIKFYEFNPNIDPNDEAYQTLAYITFSPHQSKLADPDRGQIMLASLKSFMLKKGGKV